MPNLAFILQLGYHGLSRGVQYDREQKIVANEDLYRWRCRLRSEEMLVRVRSCGLIVGSVLSLRSQSEFSRKQLTPSS